MKTLSTYISEGAFMNLDTTIKAPEKKKVRNAIYKQLEKTGTTGRFYRDESWEGVRLVRKDIDDALKQIRNPEHEYEVSIAADNGGYRKSNDGMSQWKEYKIEIFVKGSELPFMIGTLNCHAAGTIDDPFSMYDMSCCIGY